MKIKEITERECCQPQDMKRYRGLGTGEATGEAPLYFCQHCGQVWGEKRYMDAAGDFDTTRVVLQPHFTL